MATIDDLNTQVAGLSTNVADLLAAVNVQKSYIDGAESLAQAQVTLATNAATSASASYDSFDDRYLGAKAVSPTLDNDGNALLIGAIYFNTSANTWNAWNGSTWVTAPAIATTASSVSNTPAGNVSSTTIQAAINELDSEKQAITGKDASGGYPGLTLFKINFKNVANTFISFFTNTNTAARTYTFQDRDGVIADNTDLATKTTASTLAASGGAALVGNAPAGNIAATTVQAALNELDNEKAKLNGNGTQDFAVKSLNGHNISGMLNVLINGNFAINQRAVSGTVTLSAGQYGHDRWKAGASGCTYTFATSGLDTVITITAGSLIQVVEDKNIEGGVYTLSNFGTAQARVAINGSATTGAYAATPLTTAAANESQSITVEYTTGTLSKCQLERGTVSTTFERRFSDDELRHCQRYLPAITCGPSPDDVAIGTTASTGSGTVLFMYPVEPRVPPTSVSGSPASAFSLTTGTASSLCSALTLSSAGKKYARLSVSGTGTPYGANQHLIMFGGSGAKLLFDGCEL